jgi:hypothetical protein
VQTHLPAFIQKRFGSGSEPDKRTRPPAKPAVEPRIPVERCETDAFHVGTNDRLMVDVVARLIEVSRAVGAAIVKQPPFQDEGELLARMPIGR